jgi:hypothetical protein
MSLNMVTAALAGLAAMLWWATPGTSPLQQAAPAVQADDPIRGLVAGLQLEPYKATIKGLTQFGDRREGTARNRDAVAWIAAELKRYGCEPVTMTYDPPTAPTGGAVQTQAGGRQAAAPAQGAAAAGRGGARGGAGRGVGPLAEPVRNSSGGSTLYGVRGRTGVNNAPEAQPNEALRALNAGPVLPGPFVQTYCTKWGTTRPDEMYIVGAHMDGIGWGEAANDDGSGTALVMELARIFSQPGVTTDVSIRFALWNGEEGGLRGATAYVDQRAKLQGLADPARPGRMLEPRWLGMIQHDMMLWDHGMPRADGSLSPEQRPEADFNIEWQSNSQLADASAKLALTVKLAADKYSTTYPAVVGPHMTNTDSTPFMNLVPAISLRENERGMHTGAGWNPHWHQPTDLYSTFSDKDFMLGLNAAQATLSALAELAGARIKK